MSIARFNARFLSVAAAVIALAGTSRADKLVWADTSGPAPVMHTYDLANPGDVVVPITNLALGEEVVGMCTPPASPWPSLLLPGQLVSDESLFTEDPNTYEHRLRGYSLSTGGAFNGYVTNDGGGFSDIVGYQQHSSGPGLFVAWGTLPKPSADYRVAIGRYGDVYRPGTKFTAATFIDTLKLDGPVIATSKSPGGRVLVVSRGNSKTYMNSVRCVTDPGGVTPYKLTIMGRFLVTYPKGFYGGGLLSIAMKQDKSDKEIYALVQTAEAAWPKPNGEILLCKGKTTNGKLDLIKVAKIQDWSWGTPAIYQGVVPMVVR